MIGPLFEDSEAVYPYSRLQEAGATVGLIGLEGGEAVRGKKGLIRIDATRSHSARLSKTRRQASRSVLASLNGSVSWV